MPRVLFVCHRNSARSQMAQAYLRQMAPGRFEVDSAGLEPTALNPLAVEAMAEDGLDISGQKPQNVFDLYRQGHLYDHVVVICDAEHEGRCPVFPGITKRLHLPFEDPALLTGSRRQRLEGMRRIRDQIKAAVAQLADQLR